MISIIVYSNDSNSYVLVKRALAKLIRGNFVKIIFMTERKDLEARLAISPPDILVLDEVEFRFGNATVPKSVQIFYLEKNSNVPMRLHPDGLSQMVELKLRDKGYLMMLKEDGVFNEQDVVTRARGYVENNFSGDCALQTIAKALYVSRTYLSGRFRREIGVPLNAYVTDFRLERSKELLMNTTIQIKEVASLCGFTSTPYYTHSFKAKYGVAPRDFRKMLADGEVLQ